MATIIKDEFTDLLSDAVASVTEETPKRDEWMPHDWIPWSKGINYAFLGGKDYEPSAHDLDQTTIDAAVILMLHKDQLPSYHRLLTQKAPSGTEFFSFANRWTSEQALHAVPLRDYLVISRVTDPEVLEMRRLHSMMDGYIQTSKALEMSSADCVALVALSLLVSAKFSELASQHTKDKSLKHIFQNISMDDKLHGDTMVRFIKVLVEKKPEQMKEIINRQAAACCPIGADWGEGNPEVERLNVNLYTKEIHDKLVEDFIATCGVKELV